MVTTTTDPPVTLPQTVVKFQKLPPKGQGKRIIDKGKGVKPPGKGKKNVVRTTASATTLASPSANL